MHFEQITYEVERGVATITLNRPEKLNASTGLMESEIIKACELVDADDAVRVVVVTGAGRGFCAGQELSSGEGEGFLHGSTSMDEHRDGGGIVVLRIFELKKPIIAAINGAAVGFGATMTLAMDIRIASEKAKMGFVFNRRGITPDGCSSWFLSKIVGISRTMEWVLTGRIFPASEALQGGLVSRVVPAEQLLPTTMELAREIAENTAPVSVALSRQLFWRMLGADHPMEAHKIESKCVFYTSESADSREGVAAFLEKRPPRFSMRPSTQMPDFYPWWKERRFR